MKWWSIAALLALCLVKAQAQAFEPVKTWTFSLEHGSLRIELKSSPDGVSSLRLGPDGQTSEAPISEQIGPLKQVLAEMSSLGLDPHRMAYIGTRIFSQDAHEKIAYACADSPAWRVSMRNNGKGKEQILKSLLNEANIYGPYNEILRQYALQARVSEVENVGLMRFSYVRARGKRDRVAAKLLVPADAIIGLRLSSDKSEAGNRPKSK